MCAYHSVVNRVKINVRCLAIVIFVIITILVIVIFVLYFVI